MGDEQHADHIQRPPNNIGTEIPKQWRMNNPSTQKSKIKEFKDHQLGANVTILCHVPLSVLFLFLSSSYYKHCHGHIVPWTSQLY